MRLAVFVLAFALIGASPTPAPSPTPQSGPLLTGLWKGYVSSLNGSAFIAWVQPKSNSDADLTTALDRAFTLIAPKLKDSLYQVFIINLQIENDASSGAYRTSTTRGFIFVKKNGQFVHIDDPNMVDKIIKAGLPQSPGTDGGERLAAPLN